MPNTLRCFPIADAGDVFDSSVGITVLGDITSHRNNGTTPDYFC